MLISSNCPSSRSWGLTPFHIYSFKIKLEKLNCTKTSFEIKLREHIVKNFKTITFSYLSSFNFLGSSWNGPRSPSTEQWLHSSNKLTRRAVRQATGPHFHPLTNKCLAIKESSSLTLTTRGMKGLTQGNGQIKTLILATNADYALNQHLLTLSNYVI